MELSHWPEVTYVERVGLRLDPKHVYLTPRYPEEEHAVDMLRQGWGLEPESLGLVSGHEINKPGLHVASRGCITW